MSKMFMESKYATYQRLLAEDKEEQAYNYFCDVLMPDFGTTKYCPYCERMLLITDLPQYDYVCLSCDENFYECEV